MISCTEFIYAYSELFRFIEKKDGYRGVTEYWNEISDQSIRTTLGECVKEHGLHGCWEYWNHTLNEEAADFRMEYDEEHQRFSITIRHCPSRGRLNASGKEYYPAYCNHCDTLYKRVLERFGFDCIMDMSKIDDATCTLTVTPKNTNG